MFDLQKYLGGTALIEAPHKPARSDTLDIPNCVHGAHTDDGGMIFLNPERDGHDGPAVLLEETLYAQFLADIAAGVAGKYAWGVIAADGEVTLHNSGRDGADGPTVTYTPSEIEVFLDAVSSGEYGKVPATSAS